MGRRIGPERGRGKVEHPFLIIGAAPTLDPAVIAIDEKTKQTVTDLELTDLVAEGNCAVSLLVDAPVISVIGQYDQLFSAATAELLEPLSYTPAAELEMVVLPDMGHNLNLQTNAPTAYAVIREWLDRRFPPL